jgi:hypothetical protein
MGAFCGTETLTVCPADVVKRSVAGELDRSIEDTVPE